MILQNQVKGQVFNVLPNRLLGHSDLYMTELGRVPTMPIPIFNGIQKF